MEPGHPVVHLGLPRNGTTGSHIYQLPWQNCINGCAYLVMDFVGQKRNFVMRTLTDIMDRRDGRNSCQLRRLRSRMFWYRWCKESYLDLKKTNLFGQDRKRMMISIVNQALHTHSTKKKAWWALVWYLSNVQTVVLKEVRTVIFLITGTLISGLVLRQKETIDTTIKNTEITPITWKGNGNRC